MEGFAGREVLCGDDAVRMVAVARDNDPDERLQALSEEIARVRRAAEPAQPPERQPSDLERLVAREVTKVLAPTEIVVASDLGYFGRSDDAALVVFLLTVFIGPLAGLLGFAAARHWWVVLTDRRLLVFRLFEAQASFPDSGMALERSAAVPEVTIEKARIGRLGTYVYVRLGGERYRFRFPARSPGARDLAQTLSSTH